ncbi:3',5'-cyclic-nucleotide phosphodiesterase [Pseudohongiella spirulinae]|uniref:cAMP phosphodiesterases class-II:Metallo-beta-lactamase superfamily n=1 Tax=Pseudohongiella spirulinae TaxID=1249552 RepID=A0A0S2KGA5_9GAMM|nr:3',5'-cyclic-nucleotide phosphodiesterase [Pseudohongiella spirulinae]ALO47341.1 CAMP phosphodiesterases class-II:Metallo-beta-lactamase superfamily [Pseudohongiella spirulinae]
MSRIRILGCSGGLGKDEYTTCLLLDGHTLIDAGTGLGTLSQQELGAIRNVFITHSHLDHICCLPLLIDNLYGNLTDTLNVYASADVILALKTHIFNWSIWPDFSQLPSPDKPSLRYHERSPGVATQLGELTITPFMVPHVVPTQGYAIESPTGRFVYCADSSLSTELITAIRNFGPITCLLLECALADEFQLLADQSAHLTPAYVMSIIEQLEPSPSRILITHLKPSQAAVIRQQLSNFDAPIEIVHSGDVYEF